MIEISAVLLNKYGLFGVMIVTFISYSIIPFPSEAAVIGVATVINPYYVLIFALIGSTFGVILNYYTGLKGVKRILPKKISKIYKKADKIFDKYGEVSILLFGWLPFIGDSLTILAGTFEMNFGKFLIYSTIGRLIFLIAVIIIGVSIFGMI